MSLPVLALAVAAAAAAPYGSTYEPGAAPPVLIRGATVLTGTGARIDGGDVLIVEGRIRAVGPALEAPASARIIDAAGRWVTPGLIDAHSHLGVNANPVVKGLDDGNESTDPVTAHIWAEHSVTPLDPAFDTALAGGVTTLQILPGSANLVGGRTVVFKNVPAPTYQAMKFPGAPQGLKLSCGENPKRIYGIQRGVAPFTRMANVAGLRAQWIEAQEYQRKWSDYTAEVERSKSRRGSRKSGEDPPEAPARDLRLETMGAALRGELLVHVHCYRADEMALMLDMAKEFGFRIAAFHHATEAYKIARLLAARGVCAAMWADWWGFKMESYDAIQENVAFVDAAPGGCAVVHSDSEEGIQRLNQEAAKAMTRGRRAGLSIAPEHAITWITANPARILGILEQVGTLEPGKQGDVVIWNRDPFSAYALADVVLIDGVVKRDRSSPGTSSRSDFLLGQPAASEIAP